MISNKLIPILLGIAFFIPFTKLRFFGPIGIGELLLMFTVIMMTIQLVNKYRYVTDQSVDFIKDFLEVNINYRD